MRGGRSAERFARCTAQHGHVRICDAVVWPNLDSRPVYDHVAEFAPPSPAVIDPEDDAPIGGFGADPERCEKRGCVPLDMHAVEVVEVPDPHGTPYLYSPTQDVEHMFESLTNLGGRVT